MKEKHKNTRFGIFRRKEHNSNSKTNDSDKDNTS